MLNNPKNIFEGSFSYQFNTPGTYYYWSGYVNTQLFSFRGVILVNSTVDKLLGLTVNVNGYPGRFLRYL